MYSEIAVTLLDLLRAGRLAGQPLARFQAVYAGERDQIATLERPFLHVVLPDPAITEGWRAAKDVRDGQFSMVVNAVVRQTRQVEDYPWGKPGSVDTFGPLEAIEVLIDFLDANRTAMIGGAGKVYDIDVTGRVNRGADADTWIAGVLVTFKTRFRAGQRRP